MEEKIPKNLITRTCSRFNQTERFFKQKKKKKRNKKIEVQRRKNKRRWYNLDIDPSGDFFKTQAMVRRPQLSQSRRNGSTGGFQSGNKSKRFLSPF